MLVTGAAAAIKLRLEAQGNSQFSEPEPELGDPAGSAAGLAPRCRCRGSRCCTPQHGGGGLSCWGFP